MRRARLFAVLSLLVALNFAACDSPFVPGPTPAPAATATPPGPSPTPTNTPLPTATPLPTPTEGPVRTAVAGPAGRELDTVLAAMQAAPAYHYRLQITLGPPEAQYVMTGTGTYQPTGNYDTNYNALGFNSEILLLNGSTYTRSYGHWHQGAPDPTLYPLGAPPSIPGILGLLTYTRDAALVGDGNETLDDRPVRHYRFRLRPDALHSGGLSPASGDLWANAETHHYARLVLALAPATSASDNAGTLQVDFSEYGIPVTLMVPTVTP